LGRAAPTLGIGGPARQDISYSIGAASATIDEHDHTWQDHVGKG